MVEPSTRYHSTAHPAGDELKRKSVRGGVVAVFAQGAKLVLQTATMIVLARLLSAEDFGLQGMAVVLIGFLGIFGDAGLGAATVQRPEVTEEQISTLFWINVAVGGALAAFTAVLAPVLVAFYGEPRLYWITVVLGVAFVFSGLAAQHRALILREMRFVTLAKVEVLSLTISSAVGVVMALFGWRYWALVDMWVVNSIVTAAGMWLAHPWVPGAPRRKCGVPSMLHFGGMATWNNLIVFLAWNSDNILVGRFWGADALGFYGRAYQLATMPVHQLNGAISGVAFSSLSRIQGDAERLARSFLSGFSIARIFDHSDHNQLRSVCGRDSPRSARCQMDGGGPDLQVACPDGLGLRVSQSTFLVGYVDGSSWPRLVHYRGNNAAGHRGDCAGSELWTQRSCLGVLVGYGTLSLPDHRLV